MAIPANAYYPGITQVLAVSANMSHGITPTGFTLTIVPQPSNQIIDIGTLTLEYNNQTLAFPNCRVDQASFSFDGGGNIIGLTILDRRWRWAFGRVSGEYNVRREDGTIDKIEGGDPEFAVEDSERTPAELAEVLLQAAGEIIAPDALNALPTEPRPYVNWDAANPMSELANLCDMFACRVVLCLDNLVRIFKVNVGADLPTEGLISYGANFDYFDSPDQVSLVTAPIRWQHDFELEAVGLDTDGSIKPIDDLSYKPSTDWDSADIYSGYLSIPEETGLSLAHKTVFRWYRVKVPFTLPGYGLIKHLSQIVLLGAQVFKTQVDGVTTTRDAMVYGVWYTERDFDAGNSRSEMTYLPDSVVDALPDDDERVNMIVGSGFSIDADRAIVKFSEQLYQIDETFALTEPATLRLRTTCYVRNVITRGLERASTNAIIRNVPNPVTLDLRHDEIQPHRWARYNDDFEPTDIQNNDAELFGEADYYLTEAVQRFQAVKVPQDGLYAGWRFDIELDGAIQSITWSVSSQGDAGPTTRIERAQDTGGRSGIPYQLRRQYQRQAEAQRKVALAEFKTKETRELAKVEGLY